MKIVIFNQFLYFWCPIPLIRPRQTRFRHKNSLFRNFTKISNFLPLRGRFKTIFFEVFSKLKIIIDKRFFPPDHPPSASPTRPWSSWHQNDAKINNVQKTHFQTPRQAKKFKYLLPRTFLAKMHLLHFVITRHFMAACQFLSDSTGPVLRTWIFSGRSNTYRFFFPERRKGTLPYVATDSCPAQTARPPRGVIRASILLFVSVVIAAAPRLCSNNGALKPHGSRLYIDWLCWTKLQLINSQCFCVFNL